MKTVIILASSRSKGNTNKYCQLFQEYFPCDIVDLKEKTIGPYDYEYNNQEDDFLHTY